LNVFDQELPSDPVQVSGKGTFEFEFEDKSEDGSRS
jgi:hypothetical protein